MLIVSVWQPFLTTLRPSWWCDWSTTYEPLIDMVWVIPKPEMIGYRNHAESRRPLMRMYSSWINVRRSVISTKLSTCIFLPSFICLLNWIAISTYWMAYITWQCLVEIRAPLASGTACQSYKGACIGRINGWEGLACSDKRDRGRKRDIHATTFDLRLTL